MKKTILTVLGIVVIGVGAYMYTQTSSDNSQNEEKTINLMGIEMTEQQAREHCAMMPGMGGCEPYLNK